MNTCETCKHYKPSTDSRGRCGVDPTGALIIYPTELCIFHAPIDELEPANRPKPPPLPLVTHTIEHLVECPIRSTPITEIPFNFGTVEKMVAAGCKCFAIFEVKA